MRIFEVSPASLTATVNAWIEKVYARFPQTWNDNHVMDMGGEGDDQQLVFFELAPSFTKRGAVEVKWFQAYPQRQGVGSRAMRTLQDMAREDGIILTLYPWKHGRVSQGNLKKFYKKAGYKPINKGADSMIWSPEVTSGERAVAQKKESVGSIDEALLRTNTYGGWIEDNGHVGYVDFGTGQSEWDGHAGYLLNFDYSKDKDQEQVMEEGWVRFITAVAGMTQTDISLNGTLAGLRKQYRVYAQTVLTLPPGSRVFIDVLHGTSYTFMMPEQKREFMKLFGPQAQAVAQPERELQTASKFTVSERTEGQFISPPGNTVGLNVFELSPAERQSLNGTVVYHQTKKLNKILQSGGLRPRADASGENSFAVNAMRAGRDWRTPKGIFVSRVKSDWFGDEIAFKIEPTDQIYRAYNPEAGHPLITNSIPTSRFISVNDKPLSNGQIVDEDSEEALKFATQAHAGQERAGGGPYISHPMRVAQHVKQWKKSHNLDALLSAAYLHDTLEDTDTTHEALHDLFGGLVASLVLELTSDKTQVQQMGKKHYLAQKMAAMSSYALVIKLADRLDNVKDIATARTPQWRAKYAAETNHILDFIEKHRALSGTHQKLIGLIRDKLQELNTPPEVTESAKSTKAEAGYQANPKNGQKCINCTMWRDPNKCSAVAGNIDPDGWCDWYAGGAYGKRGNRVDEDGRIVPGVNTTVDVKPGETERQAAKFGNKLTKSGPPLLMAETRYTAKEWAILEGGHALEEKIVDRAPRKWFSV